MVYVITYNYKIGDTVFIVHENLVVECVVTQITLEVDPDDTGGLVEYKTYHVYRTNTTSAIELRPEYLVFETAELAIDYMFDETKVSPPSQTPNTISYNYIPNDIVWTVNDDLPIEAPVVQVTFDIDPNSTNDGYIERIIYHLLTNDENHSVLLREYYEVFDTMSDAVDYIEYLLEQMLTPTPTVSFTPTATAQQTPSNTPTITPTPSISASATPTPTPTITPTGSPVWDITCTL